VVDKVDKIQGAAQPERTQAMVAMDAARRFSEAQAQRVEPKPTYKVPGDEGKDTTSSPRKTGRSVAVSHTYAQFEVDSDSHKISVRIIDAQSGKIIRSIPPDELSRLISDQNLYRGLLLEWKM